MKNLLTLTLIVFFVTHSSAQKIIWSTTSAIGKSLVLSKERGLIIQQSIGQSCPVLGTRNVDDFVVHQGFLNSARLKTAEKPIYQDLQMQVYPNPSFQLLTIDFTEEVKEKVGIQLVDVLGKIILKKEYPPAQSIELDLEGVSGGHYILIVNFPNKKITSRIIKK